MIDKYDYFLFDWDGCLAKTLEVWLYAHKTAYIEFGANPTDPEVISHFGNWQAAKLFGIDDVNGCIARTKELVNEQLQQVELYAGAADLLHYLKSKNKKLALLSSSHKQALLWGIEHNHLEGVFDFILSADDVVQHKPHPEIIEKALAQFGADGISAIMIGDSSKDIEAANNAGIASALMYPKSHELFYDFEQLKSYNPTYIFSRFAEFSKELKK